MYNNFTTAAVVIQQEAQTTVVLYGSHPLPFAPARCRSFTQSWTDQRRIDRGGDTSSTVRVLMDTRIHTKHTVSPVSIEYNSKTCSVAINPALV